MPNYLPLPEALKLPEILDGSVNISDYKKGSNFQIGKFEVTEDALFDYHFLIFPECWLKQMGNS